MKEKTVHWFRNEEVRTWLFMNVFIMFAFPLAAVVISHVAGNPITLSSFSSDFTLVVISILFNIGAYLVDQIPPENPPKASPAELRKMLVEKLIESFVESWIENSPETQPQIILDESTERLTKLFQKRLTVTSLKKKKEILKIQRETEKTEFAKRQKEDTQIRFNCKRVFVLTACCGFFYKVGDIFKLEFKYLILFVVVMTLLLGVCIRYAIKALLIVQERKHHGRKDK